MIFKRSIRLKIIQKNITKLFKFFPLEKVILAKCNICLHLFYEFQPSESFLRKCTKIHQENRIKKKNLASAK